jgi:protein SCO1/2
MRRYSINWLLFLPLSFLLLACEPATKEEKPTAKPEAKEKTAEKRFSVRGVVQEVYPDGKTAKIKHEAIPDYMPAMTMDFETHNTNELRGLAKGDVITFQMVVTENDGWIEKVQKTNVSPQETPSLQSMRIVRDVEPLKVGDVMPDYSFTNEFGKAIKLSDYKGQALAITFIFTRCPFPTFCPRMSLNLLDAQKSLLTQANGPTNWHLFTISFDPTNDTPAVLNAYAKRYEYDPAHWSFLTGELIDITAITEQFGQQFWSDPAAGGLNHNLRTAVIDAQGKVRTILQGNAWKAEDLVKEVTEAAKVK